ncbi:putative ABC transporter-associated repeat protein [Arcanobacterium pluranimalium]|uniref:TIGR03773 family transporter-associated surface protein n=1 Tax=Arcanobacterium pluranimalium TaxID=108028 RepID=UPI001959F9E4|nr:TIGR03773 family transporter-associated surface protein [Arcanobacterium pluranimalium]MBM7824694.1 putative ABC transporter-associated repeat protein [Arcanobacterium pluranimalium]
MSISNPQAHEPRLHRNGLGVKIIFALVAAFGLVFSPLTTKAFGQTVIDRNHTDAFYIDITRDKPTVMIRNGINNDLHNMDSSEIQIADYSYKNTEKCSEIFELFDGGYYPQLGEASKDGYYSACGAPGAEPGMSAPGQDNLGAKVKIKFTKVTGPGKISFYNNNELSVADDGADAIVPFMESGNFFIQAGDVLNVPGHQHGHWYFEHAGVYTLTGRAIVVKKDGSQVASDPFTLTLHVLKNDQDKRPDYTPKVLSEIPDSAELPAKPSEPGQGDSGSEKPGVNPGNDDAKEKPGDPSPVQPTPATPGTEQPDTNAPGAAGGTDAPAASSSPRLVLSKGHVDLFHVVAKDGQLILNAKDDTGGSPVQRKAEDIIVHVGEAAITKFPAQFASKFGVPAGYFLGQSGDKQGVLPFPGWDTSAVRPDFDAIDLEFLEVKGPGKVFTYQIGGFNGPASPLASGQFELQTGDKIHQAYPAHVHTNWVFTKPGVYTMKMRAKDARAGGSVVSNEATYTWYVGKDVPKGLIDGTYTGDPSEMQPSPGDVQPTPGASDGLPNDDLPGGSGTDTGNAQPQPGSQPAPGPQPGSQLSPQPASPTYPTPASGVVTATPAVNQPKYVDAILPMVKDDRTQPAKWVNPSSLAFAIGNAGRATTSENIGRIPAGSAVWMISSSQVAGVPWLGINSQHPTLLAKTTGHLKLALTSFSGPGAMEVFYSNNFGGAGQRIFSGVNGSVGGSIVLNPNVHAHPNWVFSKPGTYRVGITTTATLKSGKTVSNQGVLTFNVGSGSGVTSGHFDFGASIGQALDGSAGTGAGRGFGGRGFGAGGFGAGGGTNVAANLLKSVETGLADGADALGNGDEVAMSENGSVKSLSGADLGDATVSANGDAGAGSGAGGWSTTNTLLASGVVLLLANAVLQAMRLVQMRRVV